jgi:hypothetical protein
MSELKMTISNARMDAFVEAISTGIREQLAERQEDILKSWHANIKEAHDNETPFPPLTLSMGAKVDLEGNAIETTVRFTTTYKDTLKIPLPDPDQPELPGVAAQEAAMGKKLRKTFSDAVAKSLKKGESMTIDAGTGKPVVIQGTAE